MNKLPVNVVNRLVQDVYSRGLVDLVGELVTPGFIGHFPLRVQYGPAGVRADVITWRTVLPDLALSVDEWIVAGDQVVRRFRLAGTHRGPLFGSPPSNRHVEITGIAIDRLVDGKIDKSWVALDVYRLLRQIGVTGRAE